MIPDLRKLLIKHGIMGAREVFEMVICDILKEIHGEDTYRIALKVGDGGIDSVHKISDNKIEVWQAKYFINGIDEPQKSQIRKSFASILKYVRKKGYKLRKWTLVIPVNLDKDSFSWWEKWKEKNTRPPVEKIELWDLEEWRRKLKNPKIRNIINDFLKNEDNISENTLSSETIQDLIIENKKIEIKNAFSYLNIVSLPRTDFFINRKTEFNIFNEKLHQGNTFIVTGLPGIGKTSFLSKFLEKHKESRILWIQCDYYSHIESLIAQLTEFINKIDEEQIEISRLPQKQKLSIIAQKMNKFHHLCIIFDSFNLIKHTFLISMIEIFNAIFVSAKIIISTNHNDLNDINFFNKPDYFSLDKLDQTNSLILFKNYLNKNKNNKFVLDANKINKIVELTGGIPFFIKIFANLEIRFSLSNILDNPKLFENEKDKFLDKKILENLNMDEIKAMKYLSIFNTPFYNIALNYCFNEEKTLQIFNNIIKWGLILRETREKSEYILHNILKDYFKRKITDSEAIIFHKWAFQYYKNNESQTLIILIEELYHAYSGKIYDVFNSVFSTFALFCIGKGLLDLLLEVSDDFNQQNNCIPLVFFFKGRALRLKGNYNEALENYQLVLDHNPSIYEKNITQLEMAAIYSIIPKNTKGALVLYEKLKNNENIRIRTEAEISLLYIKSTNKKDEKILKKLERKILDISDLQINTSLKRKYKLLLGIVYKNYEFYDKSIQIIEDNLIEIEEFIGFEAKLFSFLTLGICYYEINKFELSLSKFLKCEEILESLVLEEIKADSYYYIGKLSVFSKKFQAAKEYFLKSLRIIKKLNNLEKEMELHLWLGYTSWQKGEFSNTFKELLVYRSIGGNKFISFTPNLNLSTEKWIKMLKQGAYINYQVPSEIPTPFLNYYYEQTIISHPQLGNIPFTLRNISPGVIVWERT